MRDATGDATHPYTSCAVQVAATLTAFALVGALVADNHGVNDTAVAAVGGEVGTFFGLVADSGVPGGRSAARPTPSTEAGDPPEPS